MESEPRKITQNIYARLTNIKKNLVTLEKQYQKDIEAYKNKFGNKKYEFKPGNMISCEAALYRAQNKIFEVYRYANNLAREHDVYEWWDEFKFAE